MYKEILCNLNNLYEAYKLAHRGKSNVGEVIEFDLNKYYNLNKLLKKLEKKEWEKIFVYYRFNIYEPKERIVDALTFEGRIVQHVLCDKILKPYFEPRLIKENCACRVGKGTDFAMNLVKQDMVSFLKQFDDGFALKMDVKKYFPSIDRETLKKLLKDFPDKEILELLYWIIDHCPDTSGLPIGNQTSQWFALYYLDAVDRIIKEKYKIKYYVRYMDDLIILHNDKTYLQQLLKELEEYARNELHLQFNQKTQIVQLHRGIAFLGWRFYYTKTKKIIMRVANSKLPFRKKKIREIYKCYNSNKIDSKKFQERMIALNANLNKGDTYKFKKQQGVPNL